MPPNLEFLWDDENFTVQRGVIPSQASLAGADLGPGILYYPVGANLTHRLARTTETFPSPRPSRAGLNFLWNTGPYSEIFNPYESSCPFVRVAPKPSLQLAAELPEDFLGPASAALLQDDWAKPFKDSVRDDLDVIQAFVNPLLSGQNPSPESRERAILAKEDLDLKVLWSAREYRGRGLLTVGYRITALAAATPATGLINVTVNTKDSSNTPVSGWKVRYVSRIKHGKSSFYRSFAVHSTPTSEQMAVGNYDMWGEKPGTIGPTQMVSIVSVSTTQPVDLWVP